MSRSQKGGPDATHAEQVLALQLRLRDLALGLYREHRSLVIVYEGWDAAGKGGNIRRVTEKLDPLGYQVYGIAAPEGDDAQRHYLWRFWRRFLPPEEKQVVIFDRSWYGRVLVERVEGFATEAEWKRAYREINDFERTLVGHDMILVKFWLQISRKEQLRRFEDRKATPHKQWKLTDDDWRNRERWEDYDAAIQEMLLKTSTRTAPWTSVSADDKREARRFTLAHLVETLEQAIEPDAEAVTRD